MPLFEALEDADVRERWRRFSASLPRPRRARSRGDDGFLPLVEASAVMHVDVAELVAMVRRGELEHRESGRDLLVRPAILTRLGVRAR